MRKFGFCNLISLATAVLKIETYFNFRTAIPGIRCVLTDVIIGFSFRAFLNIP
jgi:hypothetical protein